MGGFLRGPALALLAAVLLLPGCVNHRLIHPRKVPPDVVVWDQEVERGALYIHLEWARPAGPGRFPTVLVHPEAGRTARDMRGVLWDLARNGYVAVAADYRRLEKGQYRRTLFAWKQDADVTAALDLIRSEDVVDPGRMATMGFSQGGVFSLLIASRVPEVRAVVAYYPVTDFEHWLYQEREGRMERFVFRTIRKYFFRKSGAQNEEDFRRMLRSASPYHQVEEIRAPVLLIHGDSDTSASVEESRRLAERLGELDRDVDLLEIPEAGHIFNFKNARQGAVAWEAALAWLDQHLRGDGRDEGRRLHQSAEAGVRSHVAVGSAIGRMTSSSSVSRR